jgi:hypothetical protein
MKQPINEIKRMQRIAGLITESEYQESLINENDYDGMEDDDDDDFDITAAFKASPEFHSYEEVLDVIESYEDDEILEDFKAKFPEGKDISREDYSDFTINYVDDMSEVAYIQTNWISISDPDIYDKAGMTESQMDEAENNNMLTQNDIKALYSKGFNIIAQPDWNFVRIQKDFKSLKADWRFLNNLLSSKNIPSDIDYWRGDGDKGRNKRLEISKKYFDKNIKYPTFK